MLDNMSPTPEQVEFYRANGYLLVPRLFKPEETQALRDYFTNMVERGGDGWADGGRPSRQR
jgi:hypothetical protein